MWGTDKWNASLADALCQTGWPWIGLNNVQKITLLCLVSLTVAGRILGWVKITSVTGKRAYSKRQRAAKRFLVVSSLEKRQCVKGSFNFLEVLCQEKPPGDTHYSQWAGEVGWQEHQDVQQGQVQSPACYWGTTPGTSLCWVPPGPGGHQVEQESAMLTLAS